mgnify:CR=1 FL=1
MSIVDFKPIDTFSKLQQAIKYIDINCVELIKKVIGRDLPVAGNIAVFTHSNDEYNNLLKIAEKIVEPSNSKKQKYYKLVRPITLGVNKYEWLYIRKPHAESPQLGDIDFILTEEEYNKLNSEVKNGNIKYAKIYDRPNWDMIEIIEPETKVLPYISTIKMAEKVRLKD